MVRELEGLDRYVVITADSHAGLEPEAYRPYLEKKWHRDFDAWVKQSENAGQGALRVLAHQQRGAESIDSLERPRH